MKNTKTTPIPEETIQLRLRRIVELYEKNLAESPAAREYLQRLRLKNHTFLGLRHVGYCSGRQSQIINDPAIKAQLIQLGVLTPTGAERFAGCLIFPVYSITGTIIDLWCVPATGQRPARFLLDQPASWWNIDGAKLSSVQYVVTCPIDGFAFFEAGFNNVMALHPDKGVPDMSGLSSLGVHRLIIVVGDNSESEAQIPQIRALLKPFDSEVITLPQCAGPQDFLQKRGEKAFAEAIVAATHHVPAVSVPNMRPTADGFVQAIGNLRYTASGIEKSKRSLKVFLRVERGEKVHPGSLDLCSASEREKFVRKAAQVLEESAERLEADLIKLMSAAEVRLAQPDLMLPGDAIDPVPEGDRREAELLGKDQDIVLRIIEAFRVLGVVGESINCFLAYLVMTSRRMDEPLATAFISSIGAGKNAVADRARDLCPPEDRYYASFLSGKALYYGGPNDLQNKHLMFEEERGARQASYPIRVLLSSGQLTAKTATRDPSSGKLQTETKHIKGPVSMVITTSNPSTDRETLSRFIVTSMDESRDQTKAINQEQIDRQAADPMVIERTRLQIQRLHHAFQRLLQPLRVKNPKAHTIRCTDDRLSSRRDLPKILKLIKAIAFLRQMQKEVKQGEGGNYIEVDDQDFALALPLIRRLFSSRNLREVSKPSRDLLAVLWRMQSAATGALAGAEFTFTRRELREFSGMANTSLHNCLHELEEFEFVVRDTTSRRRPFRYSVEWTPASEHEEAAVVFTDLKPNSTHVPPEFQIEEPRKAANQ